MKDLKDLGSDVCRAVRMDVWMVNCMVGWLEGFDRYGRLN